MKKVKIAIHHRGKSHSSRWINYCKKNNISYKLVDCTKSDIIQQLEDCDGLMWHWGQSDYRYQLFARQLTFSLEKAGKKVFPNAASSWHFDDKLGQKYLLEAIDAPLIKSYVFYTKEEANNWIKSTNFPKVFKLSGGSGSFNVDLVKNRNQAKNLVRKAFNKGFPAYSRFKSINEKFNILLIEKNRVSIKNFMKSVARLVIPNKERMLLQRQKGYVFFQDFIPDNNFDTRVVVVGNKCFAGRRYVRKNDWRASGSGIWAFEKELINMDCVKIAFDTTEKIGAQVMAYDFIFDKEKPVLTEISYGTCLGPYDRCTGHWDKELNWHEGKFIQQIWMIEDFIKEIQNG